MALPPFTPEQRLAAMEKAAKVRIERDELKHRLSSMSLPELLACAQSDDILGKMKVSAVLESLPGIDKVTVMQIMEMLGIPLSRRVRGLGSNERAGLEQVVYEKQMMLLRQQEQARHERANSVIEISLKTQLTLDRFVRSGAGTPDVFQLKVPWTDQENVRQALREAGAPLREAFRFDVGYAAMLERVPEYAVIAVAASSGAWLCIRTAIKGLAERNRYKTFRFVLPGSGGELVANGYSIDQLERLIEWVSELYAESLKELGNQHDLRQTLATQAVRKLLEHRANLPADSDIDFYLDHAARLVESPNGEGLGELLNWVALAVKRIRQLNPATGRASASIEDTQGMLGEVSDLLRQIAALRHGPAEDSPGEQRS
jgi:ribosomal protein S13